MLLVSLALGLGYLLWRRRGSALAGTAGGALTNVPLVTQGAAPISPAHAVASAQVSAAQGDVILSATVVKKAVASVAAPVARDLSRLSSSSTFSSAKIAAAAAKYAGAEIPHAVAQEGTITYQNGQPGVYIKYESAAGSDTRWVPVA
jgi:hypothetical protein